MNDNDLMPFGKFKGKEMANVPAQYLLWLKENNGPHSACRANYREVFDYIEDNLEELKLEIERKEQQKQSDYAR